MRKKSFGCLAIVVAVGICVGAWAAYENLNLLASSTVNNCQWNLYVNAGPGG